jgi:hypothetical protein
MYFLKLLCYYFLDFAFYNNIIGDCMENNKFTRRSFFQFGLGSIAIAPMIFKATKSFAADACPATAPAGKPAASPTEGMGKSLEYVADAKSTKNPLHKAGNQCSNCKFYNAGKAEGGTAPCTMMGMKYVSNCGWCKSYAAKA